MLLLAATAFATPTLTVRRDCDAAGGLPSAREPLSVSYRSADGALAGTLKLGTLDATTAKTSFAILLSGRASDARTFELVAFSVDGAAVGRVLVDVDLASGEVTGVDGTGISVERLGASRDAEDAFDVAVALHDEVAQHAAMVTLTDLTGDGALVEGDAFEQAVAFASLSAGGRDRVARYTFDDAHGLDSSRQTWSGTASVDTRHDGAEMTFSSDAGRCLPDGVEAPADGTIEWTEVLVLHGSAKSPKWKSVTLGLREAETETWTWPFRARVAGTPQWVLVSMDAYEGALEPRTGDVYVKVPARETLEASSSFGGAATSGDALAGAAARLAVSVHPYGDPKRPLTSFVVTRTAEDVTIATTSWLVDGDGVVAAYDESTETYLFASGPGRAGRGGSARFDGEAYALSTVTLSGPEQEGWDGTLEVGVTGDAVWGDLEVTATVSVADGSETVSFPFTSITAVYEGTFVFDADPSGGTYRWNCVGCGADFDPFDIQAQFGTGTRSTASSASHKAELL